MAYLIGLSSRPKIGLCVFFAPVLVVTLRGARQDLPHGIKLELVTIGNRFDLVPRVSG